MKQISKKNKIILISILISIIIIAGILVTIFLRFNKAKEYEQAQRIDIFVEQKVDLNNVKAKINEVLGRNNIVQVVEVYEDMVTVRAREISDDQKNEIVNKIKELYEFEQTAEDTTINTVPATRFRDVFKQYVIPFIIASILVVIYFAIRYYKSGVVKVVLKSIFAIALGQVLLFSIIAITRIPVGIYIPVIILVVYVLDILMMDRYFNRLITK